MEIKGFITIEDEYEITKLWAQSFYWLSLSSTSRTEWSTSHTKMDSLCKSQEASISQRSLDKFLANT